jgi:D-glycero-D-manno-heptose 1,7-bisphosphate phosphatase
MGIGQVSLAILDRDGTIVEGIRAADGHTTSAFSPAELRFLPGAIEGMRELQRAGFLLAIATNQPGYAKGQATRDAIVATNAALVAMLAEAGIQIASVEVCFHHPVGGPGGELSLVGPCDCRKPKAGMLRALMARHGAEPATTWMIGDSAVDVEAGQAAGVRTMKVGDGVTLADVAAQIVARASRPAT